MIRAINELEFYKRQESTINQRLGFASYDEIGQAMPGIIRATVAKNPNLPPEQIAAMIAQNMSDIPDLHDWATRNKAALVRMIRDARGE